MKDPLLFNHLDKYVTVPLSDKPEKDKWQKIDYQADGVDGSMLFASELSCPDAIELDLNVKGIYKIFICLGYVSGESMVEVSLSDGSGKTLIMPSFLEYVNGCVRWQRYEYAEEGYYKTADLTDKKIIFNKPYKCGTSDFSKRFSSCVLYIRLEKPTEKELDEFYAPENKKTVSYHFDCDYFSECEYRSVGDYLGRLNMLYGGNGESLVHEIEELYDGRQAPGDSFTAYSKHWYAAREFFFTHKNEIFKGIADRAHDMGMTVYGGVRMNIGDFGFPMNFPKNDFVKNNPDLKATLRNGEKANFLSYAFPQARRLMINYILKCLPSYFDGVSLFFHRGGFALFDKPVLQDVERLYGVDARKLPFSDNRLHDVLCSYMTQFMRELKAALDERAKKENRKPYLINTIVWFDLVSSKNFGYDVETWAKEGLIDSVSQGLMTYYEDLDGLLDNNGLIDLDKYVEKEKHDVIVKRYYGDEKRYLLDPIPDFLKIKEKYGVEFYASLPWESRPYEYYLDISKELFAAGVSKLLLWNANHTARRMPAIEACKTAGNTIKAANRDISTYRKTVKINKLGGENKVEFDVNWKG